MRTFYCRRCGNTDPTLFAFRNGHYYCRACIKFNGKQARISKRIKPKKVNAIMNYSLSAVQSKVSSAITQSNDDVYINAICGAGKTETIFSSIDKALGLGQRVGFVIPRKEVVKEIYERLKQVYPRLQINAVYGGHNEFLDGDIIVLTAHQCYRYPNKFGLMILDEYDAFPLSGDQTLLNMVNKTCYGKRIYLSATFSKEDLFNKKQLEIRRRYHQYDLPVPKIKLGNQFKLYLNLLRFLTHNKDNTIFIYVPTIKAGKSLKMILNLALLKPTLFTSVSHNKDKILQKIRNQETKIIIATTILERGITVKNLQVVVFQANHPIFDYRTLIQISGRVGRKIDAPMGQVLYLATKINDDIEKSIQEIVDKNNGLKY